MKKALKVSIFLFFMSVIWLLAGCQESKINYEGKARPVSEVEEIIADKLEVENPDLDLEVSVYEESED